MGLRSLSSSLVFLVSCSGSSYEWLPFPGDEEHRSLVLAIEEASLELFAFPLAPRPDAIIPPRALQEGAAITALLFTASLAELMLEEGPLAPDPSGSPREADRRFFSRFAEGTLLPWTEDGAPSDALRTFPFPSVDPCPTFVEETLLIQEGGYNNFALSLDDGALIGHGQRVLHLDHDASIVEEVEMVVLSGARGPTGMVVITPEGAHRVEVDPIRFTKTSTLPDGLGDLKWASAGENDEVFVFSSTGQFARFGRDGARFLAKIPLGNSVNLGKGGSLWLAPGQGAALLSNHGEIWRWSNGDFSLDPVSADEIGFTAATTTVRYGPIAAGLFGGVYRWNGAWMPTPFRVATRVQAITEYRDGIAFGTEAGNVGVALENVECGSFPTGEYAEVVEIATLPDGLIVGGEDREGRWRWTVLRETPTLR